MRWPSNAAAAGLSSPLPVSVARIAPVEARTTATDGPEELGAQMFAPSKTGNWTLAPTVTVWRIEPFESNRWSVPGPGSAAQMPVPSKRTPTGSKNPTVTVVTVQGITTVGVRIDREPPKTLATQTRSPSNATPYEPLPRLLATVVTTPAGCVGSIW